MSEFKKYPQFTFTAVDIETTGLDYRKNEILEIGAIKFKENKIIDKYQSFININKTIPAPIKSLTNIADDDVINAPSLKVVLKEFSDFIENQILCFHNAIFDLQFLRHGLDINILKPLSNTHFDTLEIAKIFTPHLKSHSLSKLTKFFDIVNRFSHRAATDAQATGELFIKLTEFICKNFEINTLLQLEKIASFANIDSSLHTYITQLIKYLTKTSLSQKKTKNVKPKFFAQTNYLSNINKHRGAANEFCEEEIVGLFEEDGSLPERFDKYEFRQGQIDMVSWVTDAYREGKTLLIEAGTGVGKSLAYLIPSIFYSNSAQQRIIISTNTKNLQEQLFYKDIPTIQKVTELKFSASLLKGRNNYLCLRKWYNVVSEAENYLSQYEIKFMLYLVVWAELTNTGDIEENHSFNPAKSGLWSKISSDGTSCHGRKCPYFDNCFTMKIRKHSENSNLIVINHSLLITDAVSNNSVLGQYANLVIDEAHNLPQNAAIHFGFSINLNDILTISKRILTKGNFQYGIANNLKVGIGKSTIDKDKKAILKNNIEEFVEPLDNMENAARELFLCLNQIIIEKGNYGKLRFTSLAIFEQYKDIIEIINTSLAIIFKKANKILNELEKISPNSFPYYDENVSDLEGLTELINELQQKFKFLFSPNFENYVFWLETIDKSFQRDYFPHSTIVCAPIEVNKELYEYFWSRLETAIITSATIAIRKEFKFFKYLTGLDKIEDGSLMEFIASSPFNYPKQMKVFIPDFLPIPTDKFFSSQALSLIKEILDVHNRGTLILFTSYKDIDLVYNKLIDATMMNNVTLLAQGKTGSRTSILDTFRKEENSVLLGTKSFWEGVDVQGKSLEILILYRLPFQVPTEPLVEAYLDKLNREGKNAFLNYSLPISLLNFKQGFGRLIRNKNDKGVIIILDTRILKKYYGKYFIKVIPTTPQKISSNLEIVDYITNWFNSFV